MTTRVDSATLASAAASAASASTRAGTGASELAAARRAATASSLARLRPTRAQLSPAGALAARYSAVSPPVKPVAPNSARSYCRSVATAGHCGSLGVQPFDGAIGPGAGVGPQPWEKAVFSASNPVARDRALRKDN